MYLSNSSSLYIYGAGELGKIIKNYAHKYNTKIVGFVDKNKKITGSIILGIPVYSLNQFSDIIKKNSHANIETYLIEGIFNSTNIESVLRDRVKMLTAKEFLILASDGSFTSFGSLVNPKYFPGNKFFIDRLLNIFDDQKSKTTIKNLVNFQYGTIEQQNVHDIPQKLYFDDEFIPRSNPINMLDCGAFNGDTILSAHDYFANNLKSVVAIEPSQSFLNSSIINYCYNHNIKLSYYSCGLSDSSSFKGFSSLGEVSDSINDESAMKFWFSRIDDLPIDQHINFVKFDIEGSELSALKGGIQFIRKNRPILAVSLYHKPLDFYDIPIYLSETLDSYKYYFRQYADNCWETTLYAIPSSY
jgi:FkbM family methyltransferase